MKLIITRHGETIENIKKLYQGWLPGNLTKKGIQQAKLLAKRLKDVEIDVIYTSDLKRCLETAKEIAKFHKNAKFVKEKLLREMNHGIYNGVSTKLKYWEELEGGRFDTRAKNAESLRDFWKRIQTFYKKIIKKHINQTVLIMTHGGSTCFVQGMIYSKPIEEAVKIEKLKNTAITEFEIKKDGKYKTLCKNCEKHLNE